MRTSVRLIIFLLLFSSAIAEKQPPPGTSLEVQDVEVKIGNDSLDYFRRADRFLERGDYELAKAGLLKALQMGYDKPWLCYYRLAYISTAQQNQSAASQYFRKAFKSERSNRFRDEGDGKELRVPRK